MLAAMDAVRRRGIDIQPLDLWSRDSNYDVLHVWGLGPAHYATVDWGKRSGKPIVMTALLPYLSGVRGWKRRLASRFGGGALDRGIARSVEELVVVNIETARTALRLLGIEKSRLAIVPNIVDDRFFDPVPRSREEDFGIHAFFLCVGNVCPRKNQLAVARAAASLGAPLLILGDLLPGEERYGEELARFTRGCADMRWIRGVPPGSDQLLSAYSQCKGVVLPSFDETQPLSALEAIAMRKPLLLADRPYARQKVYEGACLVNPASNASIAAGLEQLGASPGICCPPLENLAECRRDRVGEAYVEIYERVVARCQSVP